MPKILNRHARRVCKFEVRGMDQGTEAEPMMGEGGVPVCRVTGYASVFGKVDWYDDIVAPGAFAKTLQERPKVKVLWQHNPDMPIGAPVAGGIREDSYGLLVTFDINLAVEKGREAVALLKQKAIDGISIGFETIKDSMDRESGIRTVLEVRLWEFSVVTFQAQEAAMVTDVRKLDDKGAAAINRYERARLGFRDLSTELKTALVKKEFSNSINFLDGVLEELMALQGLLEAAAAETEVPGSTHTEDAATEARQAAELELELAKIF